METYTQPYFDFFFTISHKVDVRGSSRLHNSRNLGLKCTTVPRLKHLHTEFLIMYIVGYTFVRHVTYSVSFVCSRTFNSRNIEIAARIWVKHLYILVVVCAFACARVQNGNAHNLTCMYSMLFFRRECHVLAFFDLFD